VRAARAERMARGARAAAAPADGEGTAAAPHKMWAPLLAWISVFRGEEPKGTPRPRWAPLGQPPAAQTGLPCDGRACAWRRAASRWPRPNARRPPDAPPARPPPAAHPGSRVAPGGPAPAPRRPPPPPTPAPARRAPRYPRWAPEEAAGPLSKAFYAYADGLIGKGARKHLEQSDLWDTERRDDPGALWAAFSRDLAATAAPGAPQASGRARGGGGRGTRGAPARPGGRGRAAPQVARARL
jgi:hypothetical protein